jgi:glycosyltransferase involved in cell wall biosynthesis
MRIVHLATGAAGMYCGSCMHDNRLAATLRAHGHDVILIPLYTPLRTDEQDVSRQRIFFGGINVYLQQVSAFFRHTPRLLDRLFDARWLLNLVARRAAGTDPRQLGAMTVSVLRGQDGPQRKELDKLIDALRRLRPALVYLPNLLFIGFAGPLKTALGVPVLCGLSGEDIFIDRLPAPHLDETLRLIRAGAANVEAFVALTDYSADHAAEHFGLPRERIHRIPMGIRAGDFPAPPDRPPGTPVTLGYLGRICPDKGLHVLAEAFIQLRQTRRHCRLCAAGYLGPAERPYLDRIRTRLHHADAADAFEYAGVIDRAGKLAFLRSIDMLAMPTTYPEAKGFSVLESLAAGVPVVLPRRGSFPELIDATGGGLLYDPDDPDALAHTLTRLADDADLRRELGTRGRDRVHAEFSADRMADQAWQLFRRFARP